MRRKEEGEREEEEKHGQKEKDFINLSFLIMVKI